MPDEPAKDSSSLSPHDQMLKLVARGFYRELIKYGVKPPDIMTVSAHLLGNITRGTISAPFGKADPDARLFSIGEVRDDWGGSQQLALAEVSLVPLEPARLEKVAEWLAEPRIRNSFFPRFPDSLPTLTRYLSEAGREYFAIQHEGKFVGIIGAENIDNAARKLEMKKLVGDPEMRGKGIGKRATFLFLYHVFLIRGFNKVYLHTLEINIRNLNLNRRMGFELEGVFFDDITVDDACQDLVRMALFAPTWKGLFS